MDSLEANETAQVEQRLIAEFSPAVRPEEVERCVRDVVAQFDALRIRTYVPLLVERIARDRLQAAPNDTNSAEWTSSTRGRPRPVRESAMTGGFDPVTR